jgi:hypothetical protein
MWDPSGVPTIGVMVNRTYRTYRTHSTHWTYLTHATHSIAGDAHATPHAAAAAIAKRPPGPGRPWSPAPARRRLR